MAERINVPLTHYQAQVVIDALTMYTEGSQGDTTRKERANAHAARRKIERRIAAPDRENGSE